MKTPEAPFRLYDFLAYLFPGLASLHAAYLLFPDFGTTFRTEVFFSNATLNITIGIIAAYSVGLACGVVSREVLRRIIWRFTNPRIDYYEKEKFLGAGLSAKLYSLVRSRFGVENLNAKRAHRLCRSYVAQYCPTSWERRQAIVAVRSMCSNLLIPGILYTIAFARSKWWYVAAIMAFGVIALIQKSVVLDRREWKEIYIAFLMHKVQPDSAINTPVSGGGE